MNDLGHTLDARGTISIWTLNTTPKESEEDGKATARAPERLQPFISLEQRTRRNRDIKKTHASVVTHFHTTPKKDDAWQKNGGFASRPCQPCAAGLTWHAGGYFEAVLVLIRGDMEGSTSTASWSSTLLPLRHASGIHRIGLASCLSERKHTRPCRSES